MSRFLKTLVKVGLVELDPEEHAELETPSAPTAPGKPAASDDVDQLLKETEALLQTASPPPRAAAPPQGRPSAPPPPPPRGPQPPRAAAPPPPPAGVAKPAGAPTGIQEGRALAEIYAEAGVPSTPFSAEKLLRLVDGLKAMDPAMRKAAITAMDAADDAWTIADPVQDAQRKIVALDAAKQHIGTVLGESEARAVAELQKADAYQREATEKIRAQIAELEALLQQEITEIAKKKADIEARVLATREAAAREGARLDQEIGGLRTILDAFGR